MSRMACTDITGLSWRLPLKWTIDVTELNKTGAESTVSKAKKSEEVKKIQSNLYEFKSIDLKFHLELSKETKKKFGKVSQIAWSMGIKPVKCEASGDENAAANSIYLEYAFVVQNGRIWKLNCCSERTSSPLLKNDYIQQSMDIQSLIEWNKLTVHCLVCVYVDVNCETERASVDDENESAVIDCEIKFTGPKLPSSSRAVNKFLYTGEIPDLDVKLAMENLRKMKISDTSVLKTLCIEYLIHNIEPDNVVDVLKLSMAYGIKDLELECIGYLSGRCKIQKL